MPGPASARKVILVHRANSVQTAFYNGDHAIDRLNPDYIAVQVLNRVLDGGPASRLFRNIREEKGYTYGISSSFTASRYMNHFAMQTSVRTEVTGEALTEILKEFADIRDRRVPADELEGAKRALVASFALSSENPGAAMSNATQIKEYGFPADYWDTYPEKIAAVTAEDVRRVARKYIPLDNIQIIAVGDGTKIREVLAKFGTIEEWDADGKKVQWLLLRRGLAEDVVEQLPLVFREVLLDLRARQAPAAIFIGQFAEFLQFCSHSFAAIGGQAAKGLQAAA